MQQYYDLELNILSCLIQKPDLMKELKLEDKHFIKYQRLWQFMKAFYSKFETFDIILMSNVCSNKIKFIKYLEAIIEVDPIVIHFNKYQDQLIEKYNENELITKKIELIYEYANLLYVRKIDLNDFKRKVDEVIYEKVD